MSESEEKIKKKFLDVFEKNIGIVIKVSRAYTAVVQDREDLTNDIALELWKSFAGFREESKVSTWIYRVALNTAMNFSRKNRRGNQIIFDGGKTLDSLSWMSDQTENTQTELLYKCIEDLNKLNKAIVLLYLDGHSHDEISMITGISKTNVGTRMMRIRDELRNIISKQKD